MVLTLRKCIPLVYVFFQQQRDIYLEEFVNDDSILTGSKYQDAFLNHVQYNIHLSFFVMLFVVLNLSIFLLFYPCDGDTLHLI